MRKYIRLQKIIRENNKITFYFETDLKFIKHKSFFVDYHDTNFDAPESILNVIFAATMAPVSWAVGANLEVSCLDASYGKALQDCKAYFYKWRKRRWNFSGDIIVSNYEHNEYLAHDYGLLFSGGIDGLTTYIKHQEKKPKLFTIFGADIPLREKEFIQTCKARIDAFASGVGTKVFYIYTDINEVISRRNLKKYSKNWYAEVAHGMLLTALTAPITYQSMRELFIASSEKGDIDYLWGSYKDLDSKIRWGGTQVVHDNHELSRLDKIKNYLSGKKEFYNYVRVCWAQFSMLNCSRCEKCSRTMLELLCNNISPIDCNFQIDNKTLARIKMRLTNPLYRYSLLSTGDSVFEFWKEMQKDVNISTLVDMYGSRSFFTWYKNFKALNYYHPRWLLRLAAFLSMWKHRIKRKIQ